MGYGEYEGGGLMKVFGGFVILVGIGLAGYLLYLSRGYWVFAAVLFLIFLVLGAVLVSKGAYTRKQNTPLGRVDDIHGQ
jgi:membrane protein implicated in regulation of membrane protease activity